MIGCVGRHHILLCIITMISLLVRFFHGTFRRIALDLIDRPGISTYLAYRTSSRLPQPLSGFIQCCRLRIGG